MAVAPPETPQRRPRTARELGIMRGFPPPPEKRPTLENWDQAPFNRWTFQNVRSLIPTVEVFRGDGPVWTFERTLEDVSALRFTTRDGQSKSIKSFLDDTYTDGFLVFQGGRLRCELYFNDMGPSTPHLSQSVSKSIVGTLAGILIGRGRLDPQAPLGDYVPELLSCGYGDATLAQVLNMTSGVRFTEDYGAPDSDMTRIDIASGWRPAPRGGPIPTIRDVILTLPKQRAHGTRFEYRSIETDVLAWALERITGQTLAEMVSQELWAPLGMERDAYFTVDGAGTALADGGFNATLRDYARFGRLLLEAGRANGRQLLSRNWVDTIQTGGDPEHFGSPYDLVSPKGAYSHQWWVHDVSRGDFMARGVFGQMIYIDPAADFMAVKLSTWPDYLIPGFTIETLDAMAAIRSALC